MMTSSRRRRRVVRRMFGIVLSGFVAAALCASIASAQTPSLDGTGIPATTMTPSPAAPAEPPPPGSLTLSRSSGAVGDTVLVHGDGFSTSVTVIFVCAPTSLRPREFFATVAQPAGTAFDIPFVIPPHLDEHQGGTEGIPTPLGACAFETSPPLGGAAFTVTADSSTLGLPNAGVGGRVKDGLTVAVAVGLLAVVGAVLLVFGERARNRHG